MRGWLSNPLLREVLKPAFYLFLFALTGTLVLAGIQAATANRIAANERAALLEQINVLVAPEQYDNQPLQDRVILAADALDSAIPVIVYRARRAGEPVAAIYELAAPDGYSGRIKMVVGVLADQTLAGVRVIAHRETPGLGDRIELAKDDWILDFNGKSLQNPPEAAWKVKKDGGAFDQFTGATITPRAVVSTVREVLVWSQKNTDALFRLPAEEVSDE